MPIFSVDHIAPDSLANRWDAEYFANEHRDFISHAFSSWPSWVPLREASTKLTSGHTPLRHDVDTGDCPFLTVECISPLTIHFELAKKVWRKAVDGELRRVRLVKDDVLITIKRRIIDSCAVEDLETPTAVNQDVAVMTPAKGFLSAFISAFLVSRIGKYQAFRNQTEQMNPYISVGSLGDLMIPIVSSRDQEFIESTVRQRSALLRHADTVYNAAETLLVSSLGLDSLDLTPKLSFVSSHDDVVTVGRFDAEYFSPRYSRILTKLGEGKETIGSVANLAQRKFKPKLGVEFQYIEISNLTGHGEARSEPIDGSVAPSRAQWIVQPGDIITSTVRPIRRLSAQIRASQAGSVCSSGFAVLKPINVEPEVLLVYLRSPVICEILDLHTTSSMYPAISEGRLLNIPFVLPSEAIRQEIVDKVKEAFDARRKAATLLEKVKSDLESLILGIKN